jgi:hypothetical protein
MKKHSKIVTTDIFDIIFKYNERHSILWLSAFINITNMNIQAIVYNTAVI